MKIYLDGIEVVEIRTLTEIGSYLNKNLSSLPKSFLFEIKNTITIAALKHVLRNITLLKSLISLLYL